ncbi:MAG: ABC transporter permease [Bacteroidales bacterium]
MSKSNILIIIQREYLNRIKKKSFLLLTILTPLLFVALIFMPALMMNIGKENRTYAVVDKSGIYTQAFTNTSESTFVVVNQLDSATKNLEKEKYDAVIYIESNTDTLPTQATLFYAKKEPSMAVKSELEASLKTALQSKMLQNMNGIAPEIFEQVNQAKVELTTKDIITGQQTYTEAKTIVGYIFGFLIYMFVFLFGAQVMSGVVEEKSNRIIEIMISSVKPFDLMMGKILGIACVGLTQFLIWVVLTFGLVLLGGTLLGSGLQPEHVQEMTAGASGSIGGVSLNDSGALMANISDMLDSLHLQQLLILFACFFLGGYLLYSSLFAAIGAAVDNQEDTQQFMLPVTIPMILALVVSVNILQNPNGPIAFWFSIIPFTSPIAMMVRLPFGVPVWEIALSLGLLILGFIFTTYIAARIYRVGILMYGKKVNYKELWKWLRYH